METITTVQNEITTNVVFKDCLKIDAFYSIDNLVQIANEGGEMQIILNEEGDTNVVCDLSFDTSYTENYNLVDDVNVDISYVNINGEIDVELTPSQTSELEDDIKKLILKTVA